MAGEQKPKSAGSPPRKPGERTTAVLVPQGVLAGQPDVPLNRPVTTVGSNDTARLHLVSRTVSKGHAIFVNSGGVTYVADLASRTGVLVNGKLIRDVDLKTGDRVQIGKFVFRYRAPAGVVPPPANIPPAASVIVVGSPAKFIGSRVFQIGRRENSDVSLPNDSAVSAGHAVIFEMDGQWYIRDLGSRTGTLVNNKAVHQQVLNFGDRIAIGSSTILFQPGVAPADDPAQPEPTQEIAPLDVEPEELTEITGITDEPLELEATEVEQPTHRPPVPTLHTDDAIPLADEEPLAAVNWKSAFPVSEPVEDTVNPLEEITAVPYTQPVAETAEHHAAIESEPVLAEEPLADVPVVADEPVETIPLEGEPVAGEPQDADLVIEPVAAEPEPVVVDEIAEPTAEPDALSVEKFAEPVAAGPAVVEEISEPIAVETQPVAIEPGPIAIEPEPVAEAVAPKPAVVEPTPQPVVRNPDIVASSPTIAPAEHETPVEDFIFVPMDEPVDPNALPDLIFWGDTEHDAAHPTTAKVEGPKAIQPPAAAPVVTLAINRAATPALQITASVPETQPTVEVMPAGDNEFSTSDFADALAEARELMADSVPSAAVDVTAEVAPSVVDPPESNFIATISVDSVEVTTSAAHSPVADEISTEILPEPVTAAARDIDIHATPVVDAKLSPAASAELAHHTVDVPTPADHPGAFHAVSTEIPAVSTTASETDLAIDVLPLIHAEIPPAASGDATHHAIDVPTPVTNHHGLEVASAVISAGAATAAIADVAVSVAPAVVAELASTVSVDAAHHAVEIPKTAADLHGIEAVSDEVVAHETTQPGDVAVEATHAIALTPSIADVANVDVALNGVDVAISPANPDAFTAVSSGVSLEPIQAVHSDDFDIEASPELEFDASPALAVLETESPDVAVETEPAISRDLSTDAVITEPSVATAGEIQPADEPEFDFVAEELTAESVAPILEAAETVEPDLVLDEPVDVPLDPLSDSFPLVEATEDVAAPAELSALTDAAVENNAVADEPVDLSEFESLEIEPTEVVAAEVNPEVATEPALPETESVQPPADIAGVNTVDEQPAEDRITLSDQIAVATKAAVADEAPESTNESDLEFLDFGEEIPAELPPAQTPPEAAPVAKATPVANASPNAAPTTPETPTDSTGPAHGPSIFGFQFEGGSFLGGMPISLTTSPPAPTPVAPPTTPAPSPVFDSRAKAPTGLGDMLAAPAPAPALAGTLSPVAEAPKPQVRPSTPPRPMIAPPAAPAGPTGLTGLVSEARLPWAAPPVIPPTSREAPAPRPGAAPGIAPAKTLTGNIAGAGKAARTAEVFSQLSAPIGVEVFGGRPGDPNQFNVPETKKLTDAEKKTAELTADAAATPVLATSAPKSRSALLPLLVVLAMLLPAGVGAGIYHFCPVSTPITGVVNFDGLTGADVDADHAFRVSQRTRIYSDDVRQEAQAILEQKNLPAGFTADEDTYVGVVNEHSVSTTDRSLQFTYNTTNEGLGREQVNAVIAALAAKDRDLAAARDAANRNVREAKANFDNYSAQIDEIRKQREATEEIYDRKPEPSTVVQADQELARLRQVWQDAQKIRQSNESTLAELQKQDVTQPVDVEADPAVVDLKARLQQVQDQISRLKGTGAVEASSRTSVGTDVSVGATTQPDTNPLLVHEQKTADSLELELDARRAELAADAALSPEQRKVFKDKRAEALSTKIQAFIAVEADAKTAYDKAADEVAKLHARVTEANIAGVKMQELVAKQQEKVVQRDKARAEQEAQQAVLSRCVIVDGAPEITIGPKTDMRAKLSATGAIVTLLAMLGFIMAEFKRRPKHFNVVTPAAAPRVSQPARVIPWPNQQELKGLETSGEPPIVGEPEESFGV